MGDRPGRPQGAASFSFSQRRRAHGSVAVAQYTSGNRHRNSRALHRAPRANAKHTASVGTPQLRSCMGQCAEPMSCIDSCKTCKTEVLQHPGVAVTPANLVRAATPRGAANRPRTQFVQQRQGLPQTAANHSCCARPRRARPATDAGKLNQTQVRDVRSRKKQLFALLDLCVSSLRRGHANLLCIVPILTDDPRRESNGRAPSNGRQRAYLPILAKSGVCQRGATVSERARGRWTRRGPSHQTRVAITPERRN